MRRELELPRGGPGWAPMTSGCIRATREASYGNYPNGCLWSLSTRTAGFPCSMITKEDQNPETPPLSPRDTNVTQSPL